MTNLSNPPWQTDHFHFKTAESKLSIGQFNLLDGDIIRHKYCPFTLQNMRVTI